MNFGNIDACLKIARVITQTRAAAPQPPKSLPRMLPPLAQNTSTTPISEPPATTPDAAGRVNSSAIFGLRRKATSVPFRVIQQYSSVFCAIGCTRVLHAERGFAAGARETLVRSAIANLD